MVNPQSVTPAMSAILLIISDLDQHLYELGIESIEPSVYVKNEDVVGELTIGSEDGITIHVYMNWSDGERDLIKSYPFHNRFRRGNNGIC
jgi:hypothetical protein